VLDCDRLAAEIGYRRWFDDKMWHLARSPLSVPALQAVGRAEATFLRAAFGRPRKCLVVDLDDTLWGGILGEVGFGGIQVGHSYPGSVYREFQTTVRQLHDRGVILAINSKNNAADVEHVLRAHPDMVLRSEHFACIRANWRAKPENMLEITDALSIGLDSLVFFDDSPVERMMMRQALPEVLTLDVPPDPMKYARVLLESGAFERLSFTSEDLARGRMYREQTERRRLQEAVASLDDFLVGLQMQIDIAPVDRFVFPRAVDLLQKTNQFNLTTRRYSPVQLEALMQDPDCVVLCLRLTDRFGDNGIVGLAIVEHQGRVARLDTFLLSCRVIGRNVETAFLRFLADWAIARGAKELIGEFFPTQKNAPSADFFRRHGFALMDQTPEASRWRLVLSEAAFGCPEYLRMGGEVGERLREPA
jgi:FkbH-like protein